MCGLNGEVVTGPDKTPRPDPSNAEFREWWSDVVAAALKRGPVDGVMIGHFGVIGTTSPADIKTDPDTIAITAAKVKFVSLKGWPDFTFIDSETMRMTSEEKFRFARERITFPLACCEPRLLVANGPTHPDVTNQHESRWRPLPNHLD